MRRNPFHRRKLAIAVSTATLLSTAMLSGTASAAKGMNIIEEVVVTATKTETSLQDTPIAVSAMSGDALGEAGITNVRALSDSVPGLTLENGAGTGGAAAPYIRGIGQRDTNETLEGGVAIYKDGIYMGRPDGALMDLMDVAAIEVLRGPQGTLFGKNATGGAMVIRTNKPNDQFGGNLNVTLGNYGRKNAQLTVNVPLIDNTLFSRMSVSSIRRDGYSERIDPNLLDKGIVDVIEYWDDEDRLMAQGQLRWFSSDTVTVDINYEWGKQREKGRGGHCVYATEYQDASGAWVKEDYVQDYINAKKITGLGISGGLPVALQFVTGAIDPTFAGGTDFRESCVRDEKYLKEYQFTSSTEGLYENDVDLLSATVTWDIGDVGPFDNVSMKSTTGWRSVDTTQNQEIDGTSESVIDRVMSHPRQSNQYSQELQFNYELMDGQLRGSSGVFFYKEGTKNGLVHSYIGPHYIDGALVTVLDSHPTDGYTAQTGGSANMFKDNYDMYWFTDRAQVPDTNTEMWAAFTQLTYDVNDVVTITAGLRYNWEKKELETEYFQNTLKAQYRNTADTASAEFCANAATTGGLVGDPLAFPFCSDGGINYTLQDALDRFSLWSIFQVNKTAGDLIPPGTAFIFPKTMNVTEEDLKGMVELEKIAEVYDRRIDRSWTPMVNIKFQATDEVLDALKLDTGMAYFTYSRGFKSGGIVPAGIGFLQEYDPEKVDNFEIGVKLDAWQNRVRFNAAMFYMDYQDIQVTIAQSDPGNPVDVQILLSNAGVASISGVETELTFLPFDGALVQFNASYTDASYSEFEYTWVPSILQTSTIDRADYGEDMPAIPAWKVYLAAQYSFFTPVGVITPRVDATYKSSQAGHFDFMSYQSGEWEIPEYAIYNARLTWDFPDEKTTIAAWVKNIEGKRYRNGGTPIPEITGGGTVSVSEPRMWGVDFSYRF